MEHYEIATYGGLVQLAKTMNKMEIAKILYATLEEEKEADELLTKVAEKSINVEAAEEKAPAPTSLKASIMEMFKK